MASESNMQEIFKELDKWLENQYKSESFEKPSKWFDFRKLTEMVEEEIKVLDQLTFDGYMQSGEGEEGAEDTPSDNFLTARRNELSFIIGLLSGIRKRYVSGEESKPLSELDTNRYTMYSLQSRRAVLNKFRDYSESIEE